MIVRISCVIALQAECLDSLTTALNPPATHKARKPPSNKMDLKGEVGVKLIDSQTRQVPGKHNEKRRASWLTRSYVDRSTVGARDLVSNVEAQPQACPLVDILLSL